jgi:hypothetical protein
MGRRACLNAVPEAKSRVIRLLAIGKNVAKQAASHTMVFLYFCPKLQIV